MKKQIQAKRPLLLHGEEEKKKASRPRPRYQQLPYFPRALSLSLSLFSADVAVVNRVAGEAAAEPAAEDGGAWWWWRHGGSPLPDTDAGALPEIKMKATP